MPNSFDAHIFKRRNVGEREEVRLKLFKLDGTPVDMEGSTGPAGAEGPEGPQGPQGIQGPIGPSGASWTIANGLETETTFTAVEEQIGPELSFTVGASGMALFQASGYMWHPPNSFQVEARLDNVMVFTATVNDATKTRYALAKDSLGRHPVSISTVLMMILTPGVHSFKFVHLAGPAGGKAHQIRLAAMAL